MLVGNADGLVTSAYPILVLNAPPILTVPASNAVLAGGAESGDLADKSFLCRERVEKSHQLFFKPTLRGAKPGTYANESKGVDKAVYGILLNIKALPCHVDQLRHCTDVRSSAMSPAIGLYPFNPIAGET